MSWSIGSTPTSRRRMLAGIAVLAAGPMLQACSSAPAAPTAAPAPAQSTAAPTNSSTASATAAPAATNAAVQTAVQVTFATDWVSGPRGEAIKQMIPQFEKLHPNVKLKEEPIGGNYWDTVNVQFAAGTVADVQLGDGYFFNVYVLKNAYVPLDDYFKKNGVDLKNYDVVPNVATHAGKTYGMPAQLVVSGWWYNEDMFKQAGINPPNENWTWNDVLEIATKLTDPAKKQYGIWASNSDEFGWGPLLFSNGADWYNQDHTKSLLNSGGAWRHFSGTSI